jgi:hypothetical protein
MRRYILVAAAILVPSLVHAAPVPTQKMAREMISMHTFTVDELEARQMAEGAGYLVFGDANFTDKLTDLLKARSPKHVNERLNGVLEDMAKQVDVLAAEEVGQTFDSKKDAESHFVEKLRAFQYQILEQYSLSRATATK